MFPILQSALNEHFDLVVSGIIGLVVAVGIANIPDSKSSSKRNDASVEITPSVLEETQNEENEQQVEEITEVISTTLKHKPHLRKFFGLGEEEKRKINVLHSNGDINANGESKVEITDADVDESSSDNPWINTPEQTDRDKLKDIIRKAQGSDMSDEEMGMILLRAAIAVVMLIAFVMSANVISKGEVGRFLVGMFPVEAAVLGLKDYVQKKEDYK